MGYQVVAGAASERVSNEAWLDLIALASKHGFSTPRLSHLGRRDETVLTEEEVEGLRAALERALTADEPQEHITTEDDVLDRDTVRHMIHVLRQSGVKVLRRIPSWL